LNQNPRNLLSNYLSNLAILFINKLLLKNKKCQYDDKLTLFIYVDTGFYLVESEVGGIAVGRFGTAFGSTALFMEFSILEPDAAFLGIAAVATIESTSIAAARVHVDFSRKSAVFRMPIVCPAEVKLAASPPPLEFCTRTIRIWKTHATITKTETKI
jgi:hypothetical protein